FLDLNKLGKKIRKITKTWENLEQLWRGTLWKVILNLLMILSFINNFSRSSLSHVIEGHRILFVSGVLLTIGSKPTVQFFTKPKYHKCDSSEPDLCDSGCNG
ncbi:hypothetical protein ACJX0J_028852, partial [Zea mays]